MYKHTLLVSETFSFRVGPIHTYTETVRAEKRSVSCLHNELKCVCICVEFQKFERFVTATRFLLIFMSPYLFNDIFCKTICENTWRRRILQLFNNCNKIWHLIFVTFFMEDFFHLMIVFIFRFSVKNMQLDLIKPQKKQKKTTKSITRAHHFQLQVKIPKI